MLYRALAELVLWTHFCYILFAVFGGLAVLRWPKLAWLHAPAVLWAAWVEFADWTCPLTPLESRLLQLGGGQGYHGDFIDHYLVAVIYPDGLTRSAQVVIGACVLAINGVVYWRLLHRR